jgi:hypothetical protein
VGSFGVDVRGYGVRLHLVLVNVRTIACMVDRVQQVEELDTLVSLSQLGEGHDRPDRSVGVLPAVLPDAGEVSLDVPGIPGCPVEGRREEEH